MKSERLTKEKLREMVLDVIKEQSPIHNQDGEFDDWDSSGSWSKDGRQFERTGKSKGKNKEPCGRKSKKRKHCKKNEEVDRQEQSDAEEFTDQDAQYVRAIIRDEFKSFINDKAKQSNCSMSDVLRLIRGFKAAETFKYSAPKN